LARKIRCKRGRSTFEHLQNSFCEPIHWLTSGRGHLRSEPKFPFSLLLSTSARIVMASSSSLELEDHSEAVIQYDSSFFWYLASYFPE
jgi:hypothetical protein